MSDAWKHGPRVSRLRVQTTDTSGNWTVEGKGMLGGRLAVALEFSDELGPPEGLGLRVLRRDGLRAQVPERRPLPSRPCSVRDGQMNPGAPR